MQLTISLAQMDIALGEPEVNLARVKDMAKQARQKGAQVLVLPELWSTGYDLERVASYASGWEEGAFLEATRLARASGLYLVGSFLSVREGLFYNTAAIITPEGKRAGWYDKIHLFRLMAEEQYLNPGQSCPVFDLPFGLAALAICYDLRFPELFRRYALDGARMVFVLAEWPQARLEHWRTLLRARAIENQFFVVGCNRVGSSNGEDFGGHSALSDPWGKVLVEGGDREEFLTATIELDEIEAARRTIPVFSDRRDDLYGGIVGMEASCAGNPRV